jgi:hypothetical protein
MTGYIYIAGSFLNVNRSNCGQSSEWIDNDPHFWSMPPTWGICRPDLREKVNQDDVVFYVLPRASRHPQMIFGYLTVAAKITHEQAFQRETLRSKRMGNKNPNGNIIVDERGRYNRYDKGAHERNFARIKRNYVVGDPDRSHFLTDRQIRRLAPHVVQRLSSILGRTGNRIFDIVSRYGATLTTQQVGQLIEWLHA